MTISGNIVLTGDTVAVSDDNISANSLNVTMSTCRKNQFDFGTFNSSVLKIGIIDDTATLHDYSSGTISLTLTDDEENDIEIGTYYIDGTQTKRNGKVVTIVAYDAAALFDIPIPDNVRGTSYTASTLISAACTACSVTLDGTLPANSPNTAVTFTLGSKSIQTWRDAVMWACQLICANAIINRDGELEIRKAWYIYDANPDFTCTASERADVQFSDTRVYIKYMTAYAPKKVKTYTSSVTAPSQSVEGQFSLSKNPLLDDKTESDCDTINAAILAQPILQRQITAKMFSNPTISLGDLGVFSGGKIDIRRSIRGVVTGIVWRYHGYTTVSCTAPEVVT